MILLEDELTYNVPGAFRSNLPSKKIYSLQMGVFSNSVRAINL